MELFLLFVFLIVAFFVWQYIEYTSYVEMPLAARSKTIEAQYTTSHVKTRINVSMLPNMLNVDCEYYQATAKG